MYSVLHFVYTHNYNVFINNGVKHKYVFERQESNVSRINNVNSIFPLHS
jgi:hypothetical protein